MKNLSNGNPIFLRTFNKFIILNTIKESGPLCRSEIANLTKLGWGTITKFSGELIKEGLIQEEYSQISSGGRRPLLLKINPEASFIVGADLGASKTKVVVTDLSSRIITRRKSESLPFQGKDRIIEGFLEAIEETIRESEVERERIKSIGLSLSGTTDSKKGILVSAGNLGIKYGTNIKITEIVEKKFGFPTYAITTMGAGVLGEKDFGLGKDIENLVSVDMGIGIGSGIISHNQLVMDTPERRVGYIGHILIDRDGPFCGCGKRGCLEAYAGGRAIARQTKEALKNGKSSLIREMVNNDLDKITAEVVAHAARKGDKLALNILKKAAKYISIGIIHLIQIYHPERIILSGGLTKCGKTLLNPIKEEIEKVIPEDRFNTEDIFLTSLGDFGSALGATVLAYNRVSNPYS